MGPYKQKIRPCCKNPGDYHKRKSPILIKMSLEVSKGQEIKQKKKTQNIRPIKIRGFGKVYICIYVYIYTNTHTLYRKIWLWCSFFFNFPKDYYATEEQYGSGRETERVYTNTIRLFKQTNFVNSTIKIRPLFVHRWSWKIDNIIRFEDWVST